MDLYTCTPDWTNGQTWGAYFSLKIRKYPNDISVCDFFLYFFPWAQMHTGACTHNTNFFTDGRLVQR